MQHDAVDGCYRVFVDTASGALDDRPALGKVLDKLRPGDTFVVWKLDRLGRSLRPLIDTVAELERRGTGFRSMRENIDTTTPGGKLTSTSSARWPSLSATSFANVRWPDWRRREPQDKNGRPLSMTLDELRPARQLYDSHQHTLAEIARTWGESRLDLPAAGQQTYWPMPAHVSPRLIRRCTLPGPPPREPWVRTSSWPRLNAPHTLASRGAPQLNS